LWALQTTSGAPAEATDIARISPLAHAHVVPSGTYHFARATVSDPAQRAMKARGYLAVTWFPGAVIVNGRKCTTLAELVAVTSAVRSRLRRWSFR
jgi:hypothetical protein